MQRLMQQIGFLPLWMKLLCGVLGILCIHATFQLLERRLPDHFHQRDARYRARKLVVFTGYVVVIVFVTLLFADRLGRVSFALGVAGAGVVVALKDVIASLAGRVAIAWSRLYAVGDRIQIGEIKGDVIDISFMRTILVETGNWVSADLYNGRIAHIPNNVTLGEPVFNYSQGFPFVWDEIKISLTLESDETLARDMLLRIANEAVAEYLPVARHSWKEVTTNFSIENASLEPTVTMIVKGGYLEFTLSYVVSYTVRAATQDQLFSQILKEVKSKDALAWALSAE